MPAGPLRESVTFQRRGAVDDGYGNTTSDDWADIADAAEIPANLTGLTRGEVVLSEGVQGRRTYGVRVRFHPALAGIQVQDRMIDARDSSRTFNVVSPPQDKDGRRQWLDILVQSGGANG